MHSRRIGIAAVVTVVALLAGACGDDSSSGVTITGAWARTTPAMTSAGAAYFVATAGPEGDTLLSASVSTALAASAEVHEVVPVDMSSTTTEDDMSSSTTNATPGMMMREVASVAIPPGGSLEFKPGSYHIMLMNLTTPLATGSHFDLTLHFEKAGDITFDVEVRES